MKGLRGHKKVSPIGLIILSILILTTTTYSFAQETVAEVNGDKIELSHLNRVYEQGKLFLSGEKKDKEAILNDLIDRQLGIGRAKALKLAENPIVKEKIEDVLYHALISQELEPKLQAIKEITDSEVKSYYQNFPEYRTANILLRLPATSTDEQEDAALKKIMEIYNELKGDPKKFAELANQYTQNVAAQNGGDIGFQPAIRLAPEYFAAIKGKKKDFVSKPIRTQFGYHIVKVLDQKPFDQIQKDLYKKIIYDQKRDEIMKKHLGDFRKKAKININKALLK